MSSHYRKQLEEFLARLDVRAEKVFDVGGSQLPVKDRVKSWNVGDYKIFDLEEPHVKKADPNFILDLNDPQRLPIDKTDIVFCLEVMEYIYNPLVAIQTLRSLLRGNGTLYITFPYYYPPHEPRQEDCLRYTLSGSKKLLELSGFEVEDVWYRGSLGNGFLKLNTENALRLSKSAQFAEANSLGFIIKAKAI